MSQTNVELVKRYVEAWNERDYDVLAALVHDDMEFHGLVEQADRPRVTRSFEEYRRRTELADADLEQFRVGPLELVGAGERVAMMFEMAGTGRQSRVSIRFTQAAVVTIRDGRIARIEICESRQEALEAAGVSG